MSSFEGKQILVTGGCGSIGLQLVKRLLTYEPATIRVLDNNESCLFEMQSELAAHSETIRYLLGDVRERDRLQMAMEDVDIVFHCAALKHVGLNEYNPFETIKTNVQGTQNVIQAALEQEVDSLVGISTDKASNPTSVMGATKLLSERLIIAANTYKGTRDTSFNCVRFGNVLGSSGSVVPVFLDQIRDGGPITVTDPEMTRFIMQATEAVDLVFEAYRQMGSGQVFVFKMPAFRLADLAHAMRDAFAPAYGHDSDDVQIETIGHRPGERTHEKLVSTDEMAYAVEREDMFVLHPQIDIRGYETVEQTGQNSLSGEYTSADAGLLSGEELVEMIEQTDILSGAVPDMF
jgi:FlaA1/EpsC-like NDP-sugar epimerase